MSKSLIFSGVVRVPMVFQTEAAECGLACLAMVAGAHGREMDLAAIRSRFSVSLKGMNMAQLIDAGAALDMAGRPLKLALAEMSQLELPCVLHWGMNHFVVLKTCNARGVVIHDPAKGVIKLPWADVSRLFTGVALELTPTPEFKPQEEKRRVSLTDMMGRLLGLKRQLVQIFTISLGLQLCALLSPLYVQWVVDHALQSADRDFITLLSAGFLMLVFVQVGISALRGWLVLRLGTQLGVQWSVNVFAHLLRLPQAFFEKRHLGDVVSRFGAIAAIQKTLTTSFIEGVVDSIMALLTLVMMWVYSPMLTAVVLAVVVCYGLLRIFAYAPLRQASEEQIVLGAKQESSFLESIRGIQAIKLFARESHRQTLWHNHLIDSTNRAIRTQRMMLGYGLASGALTGVANIAVVWLGAQLILGNMFSIGMLFAFVAYKGVFTERMIGLIDKLLELKMLSLHTERLADIVLHERDVATALQSNSARHSPAVHTNQNLASDVVIENLAFRYSELDPYVLQGVNLRIPAGKSVAITGPSGCGKTTMAKLLLGLLQPTAGSISQNGRSLGQIGLANWRSKVNAVMQDDQLFAGSILENVSFFDDRADLDRVNLAMRLACIDADVARMNMGLNTLIGDMGTALSGGQKQRLLLARALYRQPQLLILDEATSHLDIELEKAINEAVQNLTITRIVIAHRPETIASCDLVIRLNEINLANEHIS
jgi:ATP-binding cassette, subfamily B, bacterial CvaB/MchF/RaxB